MAEYLIYHPEALYNFAVRFFEKHRVPSNDAEICAKILLEADLRGVDSHGLSRLDTYYGSRLRSNEIDPASPLTILAETQTTLAFDGGNGLGMVVAERAMQRCIEKAHQSGVALAAVRNSNHFGIAGYYAMLALPHDMIGVCFTNSIPLVAPTYGRQANLGTNPIAVAVPAGEEHPYVLDMATSIVPIGRVSLYKEAGQEVPAGWGIDEAGRVTTDPAEIISGGALMPLGGTDLMRGYKGYGLSLLVDIFSGVLSGAAFGASVGSSAREGGLSNVGHFFAAIRIDALRPVDEFKRDMDRLIRELKSSPKAEDSPRIYIHGEKEFERSEHHRANGVPLLATIVDALIKTGDEIGVPFDLKPIDRFDPQA